MRKYIPEQTEGTSVQHKTFADWRALLGKRVEYNEIGWISKSSGIVVEVSGRNVCIGGNWMSFGQVLNVKQI